MLLIDAIESGYYPKIKSISWWQENWEGTKLRLDSSPQAIEAYKNRINNDLYDSELVFENDKLVPRVDGIYQGAFPDFGGQENFVSDESIIAFEDLVGKDLVDVIYPKLIALSPEKPMAVLEFGVTEL